MKHSDQTEYIVQAIREGASMYEEDARAFLAEHDARVRDEALAEAKVEVVAWLVKKAAEGYDTGALASKVDRGAVRCFLGTAHYRDALDAHRAEVLAEVGEAWPGELGHLRALTTSLTKAVEAENFQAAQRLLAVYQHNHGQPAGTEAAR